METQLETQLETQRDQILNELQQGSEVSSWMMITKYGITRLAKYINDFRKEGVQVLDRWEKSLTARYKVYWLDKTEL